jgi:hypothetical protein
MAIYIYIHLVQGWPALVTFHCHVVLKCLPCGIENLWKVGLNNCSLTAIYWYCNSPLDWQITMWKHYILYILIYNIFTIYISYIYIYIYSIFIAMWYCNSPVDWQITMWEHTVPERCRSPTCQTPMCPTNSVIDRSSPGDCI